MSESGSISGGGRREFLTTGVRWVVAGALVGGTVWCVHPGSKGRCRTPSPCGGCPVLEDGCGLPKAEAWRRARHEGSEDA